MINGQRARGFLADSPGTSRTGDNGSRVDILSREYSREELTVSYRCDIDATTLPRQYPRRGGTIERVAAVKSQYDDTSCPYRMIRERRGMILTRLASSTACSY